MFNTDLFFLILALITIIWSEYYNRRNLKEVFLWLKGKKVAFIMNYFSFIILTLLLLALTNNVYISLAITSFLILLLSIISMYKARFRGDPLFPWDLGLGKETSNMAQFVSDIRVVINIFLIILYPILIFFIGFIEPSYKLSLFSRLTIGLISILAILLISFRPFRIVQSFFKKLDLSNNKKSQAEIYHNNGLLLSFIMNIKKLFIYKPIDYNEKNIKSIIEENKIDLNNQEN